MFIVSARDALKFAVYAIPVAAIAFLSLPFVVVRLWLRRRRPIDYEHVWWQIEKANPDLADLEHIYEGFYPEGDL